MSDFILLQNIEFVCLFFQQNPTKIVPQIWPLNIDAVLNLSDRVSGDVKINSFTTLPGKVGHSELMPSKVWVCSEEIYSSCSQRQWSTRGHSFDWLVVRQVGISIIDLLVSTILGVDLLMGRIQLTSPTWWKSQYLQNSSKDMAQNIICNL